MATEWPSGETWTAWISTALKKSSSVSGGFCPRAEARKMNTSPLTPTERRNLIMSLPPIQMHDVTERPAQDTTGTIVSSPQTRGRVLVSWTSVPLQLSGAMGFGARSARNQHSSTCLWRSEEYTSELQSRENIVCRLL